MGKIRARLHLDRDPNDPRLQKTAKALPSLNEDPELEVVLPEVTDVTSQKPNAATSSAAAEWDVEEPTVVTVHLGRDPNDVRLGR